ncbi:MAG TPA: A24 family peptidase [Terriglobia bacterium]|nr:A24 family peptidase [Terriglobia bacterium]
MSSAVEPVLMAVVLLAAWSDIRTRHIPNWIPVSGAVLGLVLHTWQGGVLGAFDCIVGAAVGLGIFLPFYILGGMGAGDVKLFSAVGALAGPQALVLVFVLTGLLGGIAALIVAIYNGRLRETLQQTSELMVDVGRMRWSEAREATTAAGARALRLPYGAVIAGGTLLSLLIRH